MIKHSSASRLYKVKGMHVQCPSFVATFRLIESLLQAHGVQGQFIICALIYAMK